jgi:hypothetical protein
MSMMQEDPVKQQAAGVLPAPPKLNPLLRKNIIKGLEQSTQPLNLTIPGFEFGVNYSDSAIEINVMYRENGSTVFRVPAFYYQARLGGYSVSMKQHQRSMLLKTLKEWCASKQMPVVKIHINDSRKRPFKVLNYKMDDGFLVKVKA